MSDLVELVKQWLLNPHYELEVRLKLSGEEEYMTFKRLLEQNDSRGGKWGAVRRDTFISVSSRSGTDGTSVRNRYTHDGRPPESVLVSQVSRLELTSSRPEDTVLPIVALKSEIKVPPDPNLVDYYYIRITERTSVFFYGKSATFEFSVQRVKSGARKEDCIHTPYEYSIEVELIREGTCGDPESIAAAIMAISGHLLKEWENGARRPIKMDYVSERPSKRAKPCK